MTALAFVLLHEKRESECAEDEKEKRESKAKYHFDATIMNESRNSIKNCCLQAQCLRKDGIEPPV